MRQSLIALSVIATAALAGCGSSGDSSETAESASKAATTASTAAAEDPQDAARRVILESMDIDPDKSGLAALPAEMQAGLRQTTASIRRALEDVGAPPTSSEPDDLLCSDWLAAPEEFTGTMTRGLYKEFAGDSEELTASEWSAELLATCATDRDGSAIDHLSDAVVELMVPSPNG